MIFVEGCAPSGASRWIWLLLSQSRRSALHPGDFPDAGKVTKGAPRAAAPGPCRCVVAALFGAALTLAPGLPSATTKDRFATLRGWANRPFFLPKLYRGSHSQLSIRGAVGLPRGCREPFYPQPIPLGHRAGGSKGATPPSPGVQGPGGPWRIFAYFLYARK